MTGRVLILLAAVLLPLSWPGPDLEGWSEQRWKDRTRFTRRIAAGDTTLHALASDANSALLKPVPRDPAGVTLRWRWRVLRHPPGANPDLRGRDDRAAGIMVVVRRGFFPWSWRALLYQWTPAAQAGTWSRSPYSGNVRTLVLRDAAADSIWRDESRDLEADLIRAFGERPGSIEAIGVICDSDNTGGVAEAEFGRIDWIEAGR